MAVCASRLSTRDIQAQILDWYGVEVSPPLISNVTEAVMDEVRQWQTRPLEALYPILYMDCLQLKVRENQRIISKAVYLALGVTMEGHKELLGMWISESEGAKFWLAVCTQLRNRGMKDCYIACVDGLTGFNEKILWLYAPAASRHAIFRRRSWIGTAWRFRRP
ncbi:MAG TPA: transposase [Ktedonobacteraceae bacterium]